MRLDDLNFERCRVADEHFSHGEQALFVEEKHHPDSLPIRLMRVALPPGAYPDPAVAEISLQIFLRSAGRTEFDIYRPRVPNLQDRGRAHGRRSEHDRL